MAPRSKPRRAGRGKRPARRMRRNFRKGGLGKYTRGEFASATQTISLPNDLINTVYALDDVNLSQFDRLTNIAQSYQFFRLTKIELKFKPFQDTFVANGEQVPYLHYLIDSGEVLRPLAGAAGFNQLRDSGARPIRFDDKTITVRWAPRVSPMVAGSSDALPNVAYMASRKASWLPTNNAANENPLGWVASQVPHKGIYYGVEGSSPLMDTREYNVEITVHAQFRKPLFVPPNEVDATPAKSKVVVPKGNEPIVLNV